MDRGLVMDDASAAQFSKSTTSAPSWDPADALNLLPQHLPLSKPLRAWERKPASPFARNRVRAAKVWKRAPAVLARNSAGLGTRSGRRLRKGEGTQSPVKILKRLRLGPDEGIGMSWEGVESPIKKGKIVTRSARAVELLALEEERENHGEQTACMEAEHDAIVEIVYEEGAFHESSAKNSHHEGDWEDEDANASDDGGKTPARKKFGTYEELCSLTDTISGRLGPMDEESQTDADSEDDVRPVASAEIIQSPSDAEHDEMNEISGSTMPPIVEETSELYKERLPIAQLLDGLQGPADESSVSGVDQEDAQDLELVLQVLKSLTRKDQIAHLSSRSARTLHAPSSGPLPEGFVSPVRRHGSVSKRLMAAADRRRTLPGTCAPDFVPIQRNRAAAGDHAVALTDEVESRVTEFVTSFEDTEMAPAAAWPDRDIGSASHTIDAESEWEDVDEEAASKEEMHDMAIDRNTTLAEDSHTPLAQSVAIQGQLMVQLATQEHSPHAANSPRRSPRRNSPSHGKQRQIAISTDASHLIAPSPLNRASRFPRDKQQDDSEHLLEDDDRDPVRMDLSKLTPHGLTRLADLSVQSERSSSAPPESPRISSRRTSRPRVSDDTALLQAFIKRANQSRTPRQDAIAKRESLENRRESDTVRQALASSPATENILANLDPNSSSPRKVAVDNASCTADLPACLTNEDKQGASNHRRSGRDRQRTQRTPPAALPNKISLRGNAEACILRRDGAQELSRATKSNTRKNNLGSVMPVLRLTRLAMENIDLQSAEMADVAEPTERDDKRKGIRWDQTLVYYSDAPPPLFDYDGAEEQLAGELADASAVADLPTAPSIQEQAIELSARAASAAPMTAVPAASTPSKARPKIRRLKAPRTAAAPGTAPAHPIAADKSSIPDVTETEPRPLKRSRIATPAKLTALPTPAFAHEKQLPPPSTKPKLVPRNRAIPSRLPAPASLSATTQLQEFKLTGSLVSSPPKKKSSVIGAKAAAGAAVVPKLDFGEPATILTARSEGEALGLSASPAKRMARVFATKSEEDEVAGAGANGFGMGSPAKKRARKLI